VRQYLPTEAVPKWYQGAVKRVSLFTGQNALRLFLDLGLATRDVFSGTMTSMKYVVLFFIPLLSVIAHAEPCVPQRQEVRIEDEEMRINSVVVLKGSKVLLLSNHRNENLELDCGSLEKAKVDIPNKPWTSKTQLGFSEGWTKKLPQLKDRDLKDGEFLLTNKNEFPMNTQVLIQSQEKKIKVIRKGSGKIPDRNITITCEQPKGVTIQVEDGKSHSLTVASPEKSETSVCADQKFDVSLQEFRAGISESTSAGSDASKKGSGSR
jgi:hypothetical protein